VRRVRTFRLRRRSSSWWSCTLSSGCSHPPARDSATEDLLSSVSGQPLTRDSRSSARFAREDDCLTDGRDLHSHSSLPRVKGGLGGGGRTRQDHRNSLKWQTRLICAASFGHNWSKRPSAKTPLTSPNSGPSRSSVASATRSATRCAGCCCRRCAVPP